MSADKLLDAIIPGEILREDFMDPLGISINQLSHMLAVADVSRCSMLVLLNM